MHPVIYLFGNFIIFSILWLSIHSARILSISAKHFHINKME